MKKNVKQCHPFPGTRSSDYHCRVVCELLIVRVCPNGCNEVVTVNDLN